MQYSIFQSAELKNGRMELVMYLGVKSGISTAFNMNIFGICLRVPRSWSLLVEQQRSRKAFREATDKNSIRALFGGV